MLQSGTSVPVRSISFRGLAGWLECRGSCLSQGWVLMVTWNPASFTWRGCRSPGSAWDPWLHFYKSLGFNLIILEWALTGLGSFIPKRMDDILMAPEKRTMRLALYVGCWLRVLISWNKEKMWKEVFKRSLGCLEPPCTTGPVWASVNARWEQRGNLT